MFHWPRFCLLPLSGIFLIRCPIHRLRVNIRRNLWSIVVIFWNILPQANCVESFTWFLGGNANIRRWNQQNKKDKNQLSSPNQCWLLPSFWWLPNWWWRQICATHIHFASFLSSPCSSPFSASFGFLLQVNRLHQFLGRSGRLADWLCGKMDRDWGRWSRLMGGGKGEEGGELGKSPPLPLDPQNPLVGFSYQKIDCNQRRGNRGWANNWGENTQNNIFGVGKRWKRKGMNKKWMSFWD